MVLAAYGGRVEVIPLLLEAEAGVDVPTKVGMGGGCRVGVLPGEHGDDDESRTKPPHALALPSCLPNRKDGRP